MKLTNREHILIVEDDPGISKALQLRLASAGYQPKVVAGGQEAIRVTTSDPPDLVILDLLLPDMNGYDVCRHLRKKYAPWQLPVLMLTGLDDSQSVMTGFSSGADAYLTKPCRPAELLKTVRLLLGHDGVN